MSCWVAWIGRTGSVGWCHLKNLKMCCGLESFIFMSHFIPTTWHKNGVTELFSVLKLRGELQLRGCHGAPVNSFLVYSLPPPCSPSDGLAAFRAFLRTEFSEENLEFWLACEEYKKIKSQSKMASKAKKIFAEYIAIQSCKEVSESVDDSDETWRPTATNSIGN